MWHWENILLLEYWRELLYSAHSWQIESSLIWALFYHTPSLYANGDFRWARRWQQCTVLVKMDFRMPRVYMSEEINISHVGFHQPRFFFSARRKVTVGCVCLWLVFFSSSEQHTCSIDLNNACLWQGLGTQGTGLSSKRSDPTDLPAGERHNQSDGLHFYTNLLKKSTPLIKFATTWIVLKT